MIHVYWSVQVAVFQQLSRDGREGVGDSSAPSNSTAALMGLLRQGDILADLQRWDSYFL